MIKTRNRAGFTIIELLIVVIVIGVLAAAGLAKYQNFAETSRRKTCLSQINSIEVGLGVWETTNQAFAENSKCAFGFTSRTGKLTNTSQSPTTGSGVLSSGTAGSITNIGDAYTTVGGPNSFYNGSSSGPLGSVIRDDNVWLCPGALSRYYSGEVQNVPDDYMDTSGGGVTAGHAGTTVGLGGRYLYVISGRGNGNNTQSNGGFPAGWITGAAVNTATNAGTPCPQVPFKIALCGSYGTFGTGSGTSNVTGTSTTNSGGPVGPDGSSLSRHSTRW